MFFHYWSTMPITEASSKKFNVSEQTTHFLKRKNYTTGVFEEKHKSD